MPFWVRALVFVLGVLTVIGLTSFYVHRHAARSLGLGPWARRGLALLLFAGPVLLIGGRSTEATPWLSRLLGGAGTIVISAVFFSTLFLLMVDVPRAIARAISRLRAGSKAPTSSAPSESSSESEHPSDIVPLDDQVEVEGSENGDDIFVPPTLGRREMVRRSASGAALTLGLGGSLYGTLLGRQSYVVEQVCIPIPGLSPRLDGYRIAQLSDIHFGVYVGEPELLAAVDLLRSARPDLVVLTGDLIDHDVRFAPLLGRLIREIEGLGVRDGVTVIPGNHDHYAGVDEVLRTAASAGGRVLRNRGCVIGDEGGAFSLLGVDDVWAARAGTGDGPQLARAMAMVPQDLPKILLCHNPVFFPEARQEVALQLSGHTHAGQVSLGFSPADLVLPYVQGIYREEGSNLYVNRGFGTAGAPIRVGAPPEVTLVTLQSA